MQQATVAGSPASDSIVFTSTELRGPNCGLAVISHFPSRELGRVKNTDNLAPPRSLLLAWYCNNAATACPALANRTPSRILPLAIVNPCTVHASPPICRLTTCTAETLANATPNRTPSPPFRIGPSFSTIRSGCTGCPAACNTPANTSTNAFTTLGETASLK